ncbi:MAG: hypothetical protein M3Y66_04625 [Actinomycetota bacterium]|nr:hypothetical protein [Actinomycetota bacterium]
MTQAASRAVFDAAFWSWVEHLRSGGSTTWREWRSVEHAYVAPRWPVPPTAAQLETVRSLSLRGTGVRLDYTGRFDWLADLVLTTPVGGRGPVDLRLPWAGLEVAEPDALPARELLRVSVSAIAGWCATAPPLPMHVPRASRLRRRPWRGSFVLVGSSPHAGAVRQALHDAGHAEGGRRPTVLVFGAPLEAMIAVHWRRRVEGGAELRWRRLWSEMAVRGALPRTVDLASVADEWAARVGPERVHVILSEDCHDAVAAAGRILGIRLRGGVGSRSNAVDTDLLRRLNQALATQHVSIRRRPLEGDLSEVFFRSWDGTPAVPAAQQSWAMAQGEQLAAEIAGRPYATHGDPRVVVPSTDGDREQGVDPRRTLDLAREILWWLLR